MTIVAPLGRIRISPFAPPFSPLLPLTLPMLVAPWVIEEDTPPEIVPPTEDEAVASPVSVPLAPFEPPPRRLLIRSLIGLFVPEELVLVFVFKFVLGLLPVSIFIPELAGGT